MTLLACSLRRTDALVTADGRSTQMRGGAVTRIIDDLQKIFPLRDHPVAIAHHGQNVLRGGTVAQLVHQFCQNIAPGVSIESIADALCAAVQGDVRRTLRDLPESSAVGFWVVGFGDGEAEPQQAEVFWKAEGEQFVMRQTTWRPTSIVLGGDGKRDLHADQREIVEAPVERVRALHADLFRQALGAVDRHPNPVGGHVHELLVTPAGCRWTMPPVKADATSSSD